MFVAVLARRLLAAVNTLASLLDGVDSKSTAQSVRLEAKRVSTLLQSKRHYMSAENAQPVDYDPRFLVFEYLFHLNLRASQVSMVRQFVKSARSNSSLVKQVSETATADIIFPG